MIKYIMSSLILVSIGGMAQVSNDSIVKNDQSLTIEEVKIYSTKNNRGIRNSPTRVEVIDEEELEEKSNMKPANVTMVLHESTGLQVQQTSATSGNASIRVQGLDGRYTQLLKDGYPNFGNFSSGLSILEIPPLDLKQVEVIKGPASTLFGGGAIAGVVNFISKTPEDKPVYNLTLNQSNVGQRNLGAYAAAKKKNFGYTFLSLLNFQKVYDVDGDDFSELPKSKNYTFNPRLFYYPNKTTTLVLGNSFTQGVMTGGDVGVVRGKLDNEHAYFEKNETLRNITTFELEKKVFLKGDFKLKQSLSYFNRKIDIPNYTFQGLNTNAFTEVSYVVNFKNQYWIAGFNFIYDDFDHVKMEDLDAKNKTIGGFIQQSWNVNKLVKLENGFRVDRVNYSGLDFFEDEIFVLPKISALFKINHKLSSRIGGGMGYKVPTVFTEQTEVIQYQNVLALNQVVAERSIGSTADLNYKTKIDPDFTFVMNQLFFITQINKPLVLEKNGLYTFFSNANKPIISRGLETNIKLIYREDFKVLLGYTLTNAKATYLDVNQFLPLVPKNKLNTALIYEKENNFKLGLEAFFTDQQYLYNGYQTPAFWEFGFMAEKTLWNSCAVFVNFENFTDTRQSRYQSVVYGAHNNPSFKDIWTHTEGATINFGLKLKF